MEDISEKNGRSGDAKSAKEPLPPQESSVRKSSAGRRVTSADKQRISSGKREDVREEPIDEDVYFNSVVAPILQGYAVHAKGESSSSIIIINHHHHHHHHHHVMVRWKKLVLSCFKAFLNFIFKKFGVAVQMLSQNFGLLCAYYFKLWGCYARYILNFCGCWMGSISNSQFN